MHVEHLPGAGLVVLRRVGVAGHHAPLPQLEVLTPVAAHQQAAHAAGLAVPQLGGLVGAHDPHRGGLTQFDEAASETPKASATRQSVPMLGFVRFCSICTSIPLLTPERPASSSSVHPCSVRRARTLRAMVEMVADDGSVG